MKSIRKNNFLLKKRLQEFIIVLTKILFVFQKLNFVNLINNMLAPIMNSKNKDVFERMWDNKENPRDIIENEGMKQISDIGELNKIVDNIIKNNYKSVEEYQSGKDKLLGFFVGQVMKETQGQGNPKIINQLLKEKLKK